MSDFNHMPLELKAQLRAKLLEFLADIGVQPRIDQRTGELHVPLADIARAMGKTEEEIRAELSDCEGGLINAPVSSFVPLN